MREERHQLAAAARVEVTGGFIEHQQARLAGQQPREAHATLLAAAQVVRQALAETAETHLRQCVVHHAGQLRFAQAQLLRPERHVLPDRRTEQLVVRVLEQEPHATAHLGQVGLEQRQAVHGDGRVQCRAVGQQAVQVQQQRGLARAIRPDEGHAFAGRQRERQSAQR